MSNGQRVVPMVSYEDVAAAIEWLRRAFGFEERERFSDDDGRVTHAILAAEGSELHVGWPGPAYESPKRHAETCEAARAWSDVPWVIDGVLVYVDDLDAHYERARARGATILREREDAGFGRLYSAADLEGHRWMFVQVA